MKNILKLSLLIITVTFFSCSEEDKLQVTESNIGSILTPSTGDSFILNPFETQTNTAITIGWEDANYSVPTEANYTVEIAASGTDFASPVAMGNTFDNALSVNILNFNNYVISAGLFPFVQGDIDIRVKSTIGDESILAQYSDAITVSVTPFTTDLPKIAVLGDHQNPVWDLSNPPLLASSAFGETDYEGYMWLDGEYKFLAPDETGVVFEWGNTDWGDDGSFTGNLVETDEVNCEQTTAGYYLVKADTDALTYSTEAMNWGIIGNATPTGWDSDTDLIYDPTTRTLSITMDLTAQDAPDNGIKFRANDAWTINLGDNGADGSLDLGGENIGVPVSGNYTIVLDLSNPREYTYSLTLN